MSLTVDGFWKSGVWNSTVWGNGVWHEGAYTPPVIDDLLISAGNGFKSYRSPKRKIKLVRELTKELKQVSDNLKQTTKSEAKDNAPELVIYERLLYDQLIEEYDEAVKEVLTKAEKAKTDKMLLEIKASIEVKRQKIEAEKREIEAKKIAQAIEEQDVIFAIMTLL